MLLWASVQAVPASVESRPSPSDHQRDFSNLTVSSPSTERQSSRHLEWDCPTSLNKTLCKYVEDKSIQQRMKHRSNVRVHSYNDNRNSNNEIKSPKDLHERQVRSLELNNKLTKNKVSHDKNTFVKYANADTTERHYEVIRNIPLDDKVNQIMNNGETVSMESISETTHATFKESNVKTSAPKEASDKIYLHVNGSLKLVFVLLTVLGILVPIASIIYCFWTTRRSATSLEQVQRRLADNDNNLLNQSLPDFEALMLSVQNLGCAGMELRYGVDREYMERLGIPASTAAMGAPLSSQRDDRSIRRSTFPIQHDLIISANRQTQNLLDETKTEPKSGIKSEAFDGYKRRNIYTSCSSNTNCPPHIYRHDGEFGRDRYSNSSSQHNAEIKRNYIQAPPNKSIQDVPDASHPFHTSRTCLENLNSQRQLANSKSDRVKMGEKVKGFFMKIIDNGNSSSSHKMGNAENKLNSNTASMPRSQSSNVSTDTSNATKADCSELVLNGSTNYNLHSKSYVSNSDSSKSVNVYSKSTNSPGTAARSSKPPSSSSSSSPSPEQSNCL